MATERDILCYLDGAAEGFAAAMAGLGASRAVATYLALQHIEALTADPAVRFEIEKVIDAIQAGETPTPVWMEAHR